MSDPPVQNNRRLAARFDRRHACLQLWQHPSGNRSLFAQLLDPIGSEVGDKRSVCVEHPGNVSQQKQPRCIQRSGDGARHRIGVDIVGLAVRSSPDRGNDRDQARCDRGVDHARIHMRRRADEAKIDRFFDRAVFQCKPAFQLGRSDQASILARYAERPATGPRDPADELLVDRARQHHFRHLRGCGIGDPQPVDE